MNTVAESLLSDGLYKNQFETFLSNGKLSPEEGVRETYGKTICSGEPTAVSQLRIVRSMAPWT